MSNVLLKNFILDVPPSVYILGVTNICHLKCPLCITGLRQQKKKPQHMPMQLFNEIIDKIKYHAKEVQLYKWGESLLHPDIVDMLKICNQFNLNTQISSNLSIPDRDDVMEALVKHRLRHLIVSFDGVTQNDYSRYRVGGRLDYVLSNIKRIEHYKNKYNSKFPRISLQFLRNKFTKNQIEIIKKRFRQWGADDYFVCDMTTIFKNRDMQLAQQWFAEDEIARRKYLDIDVSMHNKKCYFLYTTMIIEQDGSIPPCCFATDPKDDYGAWDNKKSILEMYNSERFVQARKMFNEKQYAADSTCNDCCVFTTWMQNSRQEIFASIESRKVSVVIPSYNRANLLPITLESFSKQNFPKSSYEIIVSDNNSKDDTRSVVENFIKNSKVNIKYHFEERQGVHYARNSAAKIASGDILYFTDDDMIADSDLLKEILVPFEMDSSVGTATGKVLPKWDVTPPEWIIEHCYNGLLSLFDSLGDNISINDNDIGVYSCHQAIRRKALYEAGGFNPEYTGSEYVGDGETGLNIKLHNLGYKFGYNGKSVTYHIIPKERMTQDYLNKRLANQGYADSYTYYKKNIPSKEKLHRLIIKHLQNIFMQSNNAVEYLQCGNTKWHVSKAYTYYYLSRIEYDLRLIHDENWRSLVLRDNWMDI